MQFNSKSRRLSVQNNRKRGTISRDEEINVKTEESASSTRIQRRLEYYIYSKR